MPTSFVKWAQKLDFQTGKVFLCKVNLLDPEAFSVQISKTSGICRECKGELVGVKGLDLPVEAFIQFAVFSVTKKRVPCMGKLGTDLMCPAGDQLTFHQTQSVGTGENLVIGLAGLGAGLRFVGDEDLLFLASLKR